MCLSAGVCLVGAGYLPSLGPLGGSPVGALAVLVRNVRTGRPFIGMTGPGIAAGTLAAASAAVLFGVLIRTSIMAMRRRRTHRMLLDLLAGGGDATRQEISDLIADVRILDHPTAVAYTLPGWHSRVVLSAGLLDLLDRAELIAVIDHERAHVRERHDLLVLPFQAWASTVGWLPGVRAAADSVAELTEMLADDWAARRSSACTLARALATVALAGIPRESGLVGVVTRAVAGGVVTERVDRLLQPNPLPVRAVVAVYLASAALLALPVLLLWAGWP